jgi:hypothetical protein
VRLDRALGDDESFRDRPVGESVGDETGDVAFTAGQARATEAALLAETMIVCTTSGDQRARA